MKPQDARCLRFQDQRTGLRFCVPPETQLQAFSKAQQDKERFEARLRIPQTGIVIYVRKDKLPTELPEGALDGRWLKRYGESYARRRGLRRMKHLRSHILKRKRLRFLGADGAVWLAFPLQGDEGFVWEEVLILARNPSTRYVVSLRMGAQDRSPARRYALRQLLTLFLKALRLGNT